MSINGTSRELSAGESGNSAVRDIPTPKWAERTATFAPDPEWDDPTALAGEHLAAEFKAGNVEIHAAQQFYKDGSVTGVPHVHVYADVEELTPSKARELAVALIRAADVLEAVQH